MKEFKNLTQEQLKYLRQKWSSEAIELNRTRVRTEKRLERKLEKQEVNIVEIEGLRNEYEQAKLLLEHLQSTNAPQGLITSQKESMEKKKSEYEEESMGLNVMTDEEAWIAHLEIEELQLRIDLRQAKITEINSILGE